MECFCCSVVVTPHSKIASCRGEKITEDSRVGVCDRVFILYTKPIPFVWETIAYGRTESPQTRTLLEVAEKTKEIRAIMGL